MPTQAPESVLCVERLMDNAKDSIAATREELSKKAADQPTWRLLSLAHSLERDDATLTLLTEVRNALTFDHASPIEALAAARSTMTAALLRSEDRDSAVTRGRREAARSLQQTIFAS